MLKNKSVFRFLFGTEPDEVRDNIILTSFLPVEKFIHTSFKKKEFKGRLYSGVHARPGDKGYTVIRIPFGAASAGDCVLLLGMTGAKILVYAGSCGGIGGSDIGDIFVADKAFSGGGFSENYAPYGGVDSVLDTGKFFTADSCLTEELVTAGVSIAGDHGILKRGVVFTTGSLVSETRLNLEKIERHGFDGIDMELSAIYHAAGISGIASAGILFVSDLPLKKPFWLKPDDPEKEKLKLSVEKVIKLCFLTAGV